MACGVPCVGTRVEAVPEIIRDGETGLLVPPGDAVELAAALERLLSEPRRARLMGARGRARVAARFLWRHVAERLDRALMTAVLREGARRLRRPLGASPERGYVAVRGWTRPRREVGRGSAPG